VIFLPVAVPLLLLLLLAGLLVVFVVLVELRVLAYAYQKIGVRPRYVFAVMVLTLLGSHVNIPLYAVPVERVVAPHVEWMFGRPYEIPGIVEAGRTVILGSMSPVGRMICSATGPPASARPGPPRCTPAFSSS